MLARVYPALSPASATLTRSTKYARSASYRRWFGWAGAVKNSALGAGSAATSLVYQKRHAGGREPAGARVVPGSVSSPQLRWPDVRRPGLCKPRSPIYNTSGQITISASEHTFGRLAD